MSPQNADRWRPNVAAVVVDAAGNVLLGGNPEETRHWHFPQGGVEDDEPFADAVLRELWEETGLNADSCRIVARYGGLRYRYRKDNPKSGKWKGQEQCYFLISCSLVCPKVSPRRGHEFTTFTWLPLQLLNTELFAPVKRKAIAPVLECFFPQGVPWSPESAAHRLSPGRYRLMPGTQSLDMRNPGDRSLFGGGKEEAEAELDDLAEAILSRQKEGTARTVLLLFGMEGCGMRGCLRRLASAMDALSTRVNPPLFQREAPDFLWPLHAALPVAGETLLLSHSPYDELLVMEPELRDRRLAHLVDFEKMLAEEGFRLIKAYLHISEDKFLEKECEGMGDAERTAASEAWRARSSAAEALVNATTHPAAPWYIIPSDRRWYRDMVLLRLLANFKF